MQQVRWVLPWRTDEVVENKKWNQTERRELAIYARHSVGEISSGQACIQQRGKPYDEVEIETTGTCEFQPIDGKCIACLFWCIMNARSWFISLQLVWIGILYVWALRDSGHLSLNRELELWLVVFPLPGLEVTCFSTPLTALANNCQKWACKTRLQQSLLRPWFGYALLWTRYWFKKCLVDLQLTRNVHTFNECITRMLVWALDCSHCSDQSVIKNLEGYQNAVSSGTAFIYLITNLELGI